MMKLSAESSDFQIGRGRNDSVFFSRSRVSSKNAEERGNGARDALDPGCLSRPAAGDRGGLTSCQDETGLDTSLAICFRSRR